MRQCLFEFFGAARGDVATARCISDGLQTRGVSISGIAKPEELKEALAQTVDTLDQALREI